MPAPAAPARRTASSTVGMTHLRSFIQKRMHFRQKTRNIQKKTNTNTKYRRTSSPSLLWRWSKNKRGIWYKIPKTSSKYKRKAGQRLNIPSPEWYPSADIVYWISEAWQTVSHSRDPVWSSGQSEWWWSTGQRLWEIYFCDCERKYIFVHCRTIWWD